MNKDDCILAMKVNERGMADGKPCCDGCNAQIPKDENGDHAINALILDGQTFYGLECDDCVKRYFSKLRKDTEEQASKD